MESNIRKFPYTLLWIMIVSSFVTLNIGAFQLLCQHIQIAHLLLILSLICYGIVWLIIFIDIVKSPISPNSKALWLILMFAAAPITEIVYLIMRKRLLNMRAAVK